MSCFHGNAVRIDHPANLYDRLKLPGLIDRVKFPYAYIYCEIFRFHVFFFFFRLFLMELEQFQVSLPFQFVAFLRLQTLIAGDRWNVWGIWKCSTLLLHLSEVSADRRM